MAALDLSTVVIPGVVRQNTLGNATEPRSIVLPTNMAGVRGGGLTVCVYPVGTAVYWVSPDKSPYPADTTPVFDPVAQTEMGYCPADQWTSIPWDPSNGDPATIALVSRDAAQVVYVAVYPARVPA